MQEPTSKSRDAPMFGFMDRTQAGHVLARGLERFKGKGDVVVLGLPRGGVPVAAEVARELDAPLDVFLVKKIGVPGHEELALGAAASGGTILINQDLASMIDLTQNEIDALAARAQHELQARETLYRANLEPQDLEGKTIIVIDDGLATGSSMQAAVAALRRRHPAHVIVAVPVAAKESCEELRAIADDVVCAVVPEHFFAVGAWYRDFRQTTDDEVIRLLRDAARRRNKV